MENPGQDRRRTKFQEQIRKFVNYSGRGTVEKGKKRKTRNVIPL